MTDPDPSDADGETREVTIDGELSGGINGRIEGTVEFTPTRSEPDPEPETEPAPEPSLGEYVLEIGTNASTPAMTYSFTVPGDATVTEEASLEEHDEVETVDGDTRVTGLVGPKGSDSYRLTERPTSWEALDNDRRIVAERRYELHLDGNDVSVDDLLQGGKQTRRLEIATPQSVEYRFRTTGPIAKVRDPESDWSAEESNDTIEQIDGETWEATGFTGNNYGDSWDFRGDLVEIEPVGDGSPVSVYIDGEQIRTSSINDGDGSLERVEPQVGGGGGYERTIPPSQADVEVSDLKSLGHALDDASEGDVVYLSGTASIDMASSELTVPEGVTLASNRGIDGAPGGLLKTGRETKQVHVKRGGRVTGLRVQGKYYSYFDPRGDPEYPTGTGIRVTGQDVEIDNCEIWGHAYAGINASSRTPHIHHNHVHHTPRAGLGYGVVMSGGHPVIEWNYFNYNRHAIAGSGAGGYTARFNRVGPETIGHIFDMHKPGGDRIEIYQNTVEGHRMLQSSGGKYTAAVMIRGTPTERCKITKNWFYNDKKPRSAPSGGFTNESIVQVHVNEWKNVEWEHNHLGKSEPDDPDIGCPR